MPNVNEAAENVFAAADVVRPGPRLITGIDASPVAGAVPSAGSETSLPAAPVNENVARCFLLAGGRAAVAAGGAVVVALLAGVEVAVAAAVLEREGGRAAVAAGGAAVVALLAGIEVAVTAAVLGPAGGRAAAAAGGVAVVALLGGLADAAAARLGLDLVDAADDEARDVAVGVVPLASGVHQWRQPPPPPTPIVVVGLAGRERGEAERLVGDLSRRSRRRCRVLAGADPRVLGRVLHRAPRPARRRS